MCEGGGQSICTPNQLALHRLSRHFIPVPLPSRTSVSLRISPFQHSNAPVKASTTSPGLVTCLHATLLLITHPQGLLTCSHASLLPTMNFKALSHAPTQLLKLTTSSISTYSIYLHNPVSHQSKLSWKCYNVWQCREEYKNIIRPCMFFCFLCT